MKICIVSMKLAAFLQGQKQTAIGGAEAQASFLADSLSDAGHQVTIVVSDYENTGTIPYAVENAYASIEGIPGLRFFSPRWTGIMRALKHADADVYYQRNAGMITGLTGMFCRREGKVFVYGAGSDTDFAGWRAPVGGPRDRLLYNRGLKLTSGVVVQNSQQEVAAKAMLDHPLCTIPNGVRPPETIGDETRDRIVWVGGLWRVKRPDVAIEIARRLPDWKFTLIGGDIPSQPECGEEVRRLASGVPNVELKGRLTRQQVQEELRRAAALINTSELEGFPNAYLEAWSHGVPVVTFNDVDNIISENSVGVVCETVDQMVSAVRSVVDDEAARRSMGERARAMVTRRFSPEALARQYTAFFESLLGRDRRAGLR